jgi:hypothetical protein
MRTPAWTVQALQPLGQVRPSTPSKVSNIDALVIWKAVNIKADDYQISEGKEHCANGEKSVTDMDFTHIDAFAHIYQHGRPPA